MGLVARRDLQDPGLHLGKALLLEPGPHRACDRQLRAIRKRLPIGMTARADHHGDGWSVAAISDACRNGSQAPAANEPHQQRQEIYTKPLILFDFLAPILRAARPTTQDIARSVGLFMSKDARHVHSPLCRTNCS